MDNTFRGEDSAGAKPTSESRNQLVVVNYFFQDSRTLPYVVGYQLCVATTRLAMRGTSPTVREGSDGALMSPP
jgi:hypothetical protein